jgi:hypothetical protein
MPPRLTKVAMGSRDGLNRGGEAEGAKTSSLKPEIFVTVPVNNFSKWAFSIIGMNYPDWKILEK